MYGLSSKTHAAPGTALQIPHLPTGWSAQQGAVDTIQAGARLMRSSRRLAVLAAPFRVSHHCARWSPHLPDGRHRGLQLCRCWGRPTAVVSELQFPLSLAHAHDGRRGGTDTMGGGGRATRWGRRATRRRQMSKGTTGEMGTAEGAVLGASGKETGTARAGSEPRPVVVCGPSGVGKGTLIGKLMQTHAAQFGFSVSHTTRAPRPGEQDGVHYHFAEKVAMQAEVDQVRRRIRMPLERLVAARLGETLGMGSSQGARVLGSSGVRTLVRLLLGPEDVLGGLRSNVLSNTKSRVR